MSNWATVTNHDGTPLIGVKVVHRYYILVTMESGEAGLTLFNRPQNLRILRQLITDLEECVGKNNVVWISPERGRPEEKQPDVKRNPTRGDFIDALKGTNNEVIFNYGHGHDRYPILIFLDGRPLSSIKEHLNADEIEREVPDANNRTKRSQNYVCHQKPHENRWHDVLPNAKFYFKGRTNESEMAPLFLNHLADEINRICPGTHNRQYIFRCTETPCNKQNDRCADATACEDDYFINGRASRIGEIVFRTIDRGLQ
jgi:hypothetical protein